MIYSKWRADRGGYDYFETSGPDIPLGNDIPVPTLPEGTRIGVASIEAGHPIPAGAKPAGSGALAVGLISPTKRARGLLGLGSLAQSFVPGAYLWFASGIVGGWAILKYKKRR